MSPVRHAAAEPVDKKFFTPGVKILLTLFGLGTVFGLYRFVFGLGAITNLNDQYPLGLWIGVDVATGVALAGGGFTTAALIHIFYRGKSITHRISQCNQFYFFCFYPQSLLYFSYNLIVAHHCRFPPRKLKNPYSTTFSFF